MRRNRNGKLAAVLAAAVLAAGIGGCGNTDNTKDTKDTQGISANSAEASAENGTADETGDPAEDKETGGAVQNLSAEGSSAMGRYMESEIALPEGMSIIWDQQEAEDGTLRLLAGGETPAVWESKNGGETWEQKLNLSELMGLGDDKYIFAAKFSPDGGVFCNVCSDDAEDGADGSVEAAGPDGTAEAAGDGAADAAEEAENGAADAAEVTGDGADTAEDGSAGAGGSLADAGFAKVLPDGTVKTVAAALPATDYGMMTWGMAYMEPGKVLVRTISSNQLYLLDDESGELLDTFNEEDKYCGYFTASGGKIFIFGDGVTTIDYASGAESTADGAIEEMLESDSDNLMVTSMNTYPVIMCSGSEEGTVYFANQEGLYRYRAGGSVIEQLADGKLNSLAKPSISLFGMMALGDGSFLLSVVDEMNPKLLHLVYDESIPTVPDTELKVYALKDNAEVQQAISMFQTRNPKYYVSLETGTSGEDAVTASDALRTLNTEIMAGNGPDVLILDGMPMDSYMEKGVLKDISGIYSELLQEDGLQENVTGIYQKDGAVYAVPSRFKVPVLVGDAETIAQIEDMDSLGSAAEQLRAEDEETASILDVMNAYWLQKIFYGVYSPTLLAEDGTLDTQVLTDYMTELKMLFDLNYYSEDEKEYRMFTEYNDPYDFSAYISVQDWVEGNIKLQFVNLSSGYNLADLTSTCALKEGLDYRLAPASQKNVFIPATIVGVSAKSSQTEGAEEFVKFMLSEAAQSVNQGGGFPVNKKALDTELFADKLAAALSEEEKIIGSAYYTTKDENGVVKEFTYDTVLPEQAEIDRFKELIDSLDTPSLTDAVMEELSAEQAGKCITGEVTVEEAVSAVSQKMNLYLAE